MMDGNEKHEKKAIEKLLMRDSSKTKRIRNADKNPELVKMEQHADAFTVVYPTNSLFFISILSM